MRNSEVLKDAQALELFKAGKPCVAHEPVVVEFDPVDLFMNDEFMPIAKYMEAIKAPILKICNAYEEKYEDLYARWSDRDAEDEDTDGHLEVTWLEMPNAEQKIQFNKRIQALEQRKKRERAEERATALELLRKHPDLLPGVDIEAVIGAQRNKAVPEGGFNV